MKKPIRPPETGRHATYTDAAQDEVELCYTIEGGKHAGERAKVYYSAARYEAKQVQHGITIYPFPAPFTP